MDFKVGDKVRLKKCGDRWEGVVSGFIHPTQGSLTNLIRVDWLEVKSGKQSRGDMRPDFLHLSSNQGCGTCVVCGQPTRSCDGFTEVYHVCQNATCEMHGK